MSDLISRQAAIDAMMALKAEDDEMYGCSIPESFDGERAVETLRKLPSVQPKCKTAKWESISDVIWYCSECKYAHSRSNYCPHCGAKMIKENFKENI